MNKIAIFLAALLASVVFVGCGDDNEQYKPDGPIDLIWTSQTLKVEKDPGAWDTFVVPAEGGTYTLTTNNKHNPIVEAVFEGSDFTKKNEDYKRYFVEETEGATVHHIKTPNIEVNIDQQTMTVTIQPNTTGKDRYFNIATTIPVMYIGYAMFRQKGEILK